jgi:hypothetical protein
MALIARLVVMFSGSFDGLWTRESMTLAIDGLVRPQVPPGALPLLYIDIWRRKLRLQSSMEIRVRSTLTY